MERGIYLLPNGKYAVSCRRAGRQWYRTVGSDLARARSAREALIASAEAGVAPSSPRLRVGTVAVWWLARFEAKVAAGERHPRTLESHRYHLERHVLPALATKRTSALTVDDVAMLLSDLRGKGCSGKTTAGALAAARLLPAGRLDPVLSKRTRAGKPRPAQLHRIDVVSQLPVGGDRDQSSDAAAGCAVP